jgi:hypothetical protein
MRIRGCLALWAAAIVREKTRIAGIMARATVFNRASAGDVRSIKLSFLEASASRDACRARPRGRDALPARAGYGSLGS